MAEGTQNPTATSGAADSATSGAVLIATFYVRRGNEEQIPALHELLYQSLGPEPRGSQADYEWWTRDHTTGLCFNPPGKAAHDTTAVQLVMNHPDNNAPGNTAGTWEELRRKLEGVVNAGDPNGMGDIWGYTLVYEAVVKEGFDANEVLKELLPAVGRLRSSDPSKVLEPVRQFEVPGGWAWLLGIPDRGDGLDAEMVYVALASEGQEQELISQFYSMSASHNMSARFVAELLRPDLIAHKGYYHIRQFRRERQERGYEEKLGNLRETTDRLLEDLRKGDHLLKDLQEGGEGSNRLEALFQLYCRLLTVVSALKGLQVGMLQQSENLDEWRSKARYNEALEYHQDQLKMATRELELKVEPLQSDLEIADKAVSLAQVQVDKAQLQADKAQEEEQRRINQDQEDRHRRIVIFVAVLTAVLTVPGLLNQQAVAALPWLLGMRELDTTSTPDMLVILVVQVIVIVVVAFLFWVIGRKLTKPRENTRSGDREVS